MTPNSIFEVIKESSNYFENKEVSITIKIRIRKMETFLSPTGEEERILNSHVAQ